MQSVLDVLQKSPRSYLPVVEIKDGEAPTSPMFMPGAAIFLLPVIMDARHSLQHLLNRTY